MHEEKGDRSRTLPAYTADSNSSIDMDSSPLRFFQCCIRSLPGQYPLKSGEET